MLLLKSLLKFHEIPQYDLSRRLGRSQAYVSNLLRGITLPTRAEAEAIKDFVHATSVDDIFPNVREDNPNK